ncbi:TetR/AcrR family transcriptional regulator [Nocardia jejuensis]|uniref:TetR/AcrR family transcriptional regulator n=1 Tax=Nocardia jejuensis TaxID=328049 RepID=UPI000836F738|nr:TetR/AcrR family transcriptional regulator [Nocardia jejuensis]
MARPRNFDEDRAVEAAMRTFWASGYEATSTADLCAATGLGRSSIYNTFKSKNALFEKALRRYMDQKNAPVLELMDGDAPVRDKMRALLWRVIDQEIEEPPGCLVVNSMVELAPHDPRVARSLRRDLDVRVETLRSAFEAGRRRKEIAAECDSLGLAHFVIATISGMQVAARGGADRVTLEAIATTALGAF